MAEREAAKAKKRPQKAVAEGRPVIGSRSEFTDPSIQIQALEAERNAMKAELDAAKARIAELERVREQVLNRIDWVIDSLHNLVEE